MKIMFLTSAYENIAGYWRSYYLAKNLAARGHTVYMFAQTNSFKVTSKFVDNFYVYLLPSFSNKKRASILASGLSIPFQMGFNSLSCLSQKIDVLHVFDALFPQNAICVLLSKMKPIKNRPLIFVDWDDWWGRGGILDTFHKNLGSPTNRFLTFMEEKVPLYGDAVTISNQTLKKRGLFVGINPEKIIILPNGTNMESIDEIDTPTARKLVNLPENSIIYSCSKSSFDIIKPKDDPLWDLLVAHKSVSNANPNVFLCFIGEGSEKCLTLARKYGLVKNVISIGWQPSEKFYIYLAASDFVVLPLGGSYKWAIDPRCPLRLLDYMASGKPIIATDIPEIRRMLEGCGMLIKQNDPRDLANKINDMIKNLEFWSLRAKKNRGNIIKHYSWKNLAIYLENNYNTYKKC
jgi:glycosyltransferase involved in cell wall biosynthesis